MRAVIFTDIVTRTSVDLSLATMEAAKKHPGFEVCGIVTRAGEEWSPPLKKQVGTMGRQLLVRATGGPSPHMWLPDGERLAKKLQVPVIVPDGSVNDPAFIERLHQELSPDILLSFFATSIFKPALLDTMDQAVNYHDGLLPHYAGLVATEQSIYHNETVSGYTFHRITPGIDDGPILVQGSVPIQGAKPRETVYKTKVAASVQEIPTVLDMIVANEPGRPQTGEGSYYSQADYNALVEIDQPQDYTVAELQRLLRAFGTLKVRIDDTTEHISEISPADPGAPFSFPTADGTLMKATRIAGLPTAFTRARRRLRRS